MVSVQSLNAAKSVVIAHVVTSPVLPRRGPDRAGTARLSQGYDCAFEALSDHQINLPPVIECPPRQAVLQYQHGPGCGHGTPCFRNACDAACLVAQVAVEVPALLCWSRRTHPQICSGLHRTLSFLWTYKITDSVSFTALGFSVCRRPAL